MYDNTASRMSHVHDTFDVSTSCRRPTYRAFSRLFNCLPRARDNQCVRTSRRHDTLAIITTRYPSPRHIDGWRTVCPSDRSTVFLMCDIKPSALAVVTKHRRLHDLLTSGLLSSNRNNLDITAVERIQLAVRLCDRRPHQLSFYSKQQNDAKGIADFERHKAHFCDYFFSEHCICVK